MFPYPSGEGLHVGHAFAFSGADVYGRLKRMQGYDVFQPMGYDSFGIHSENYAIKVNEHPRELTVKTAKRYEAQLKSLGIGYAWREKLFTSDPEYYTWTQWIFIQLFKAGLAYRKKASVNWCPKCLTVLADEQVVAGACERCGTEVIPKDLEQWFFKTTDYAKRLLDGLDHIDWVEKIKVAQRHWIGKSDGALITFPLVDVPGQKDDAHSLEVFTTRPDTLYGVTFMVISPERAKLWIDIGWQANDDVKKYITDTLPQRMLGKEKKVTQKTGIFSGVSAINPANKEKIPVWISDYVLGEVGTGAIMAVPAHDERDFEFAKKFNLPIKIVIEPETGKALPDEQSRSSIVAIIEDTKTKKFLTLDWGPKLGGTLFIGGGREKGEDEITAAQREIQEETGYTNLELVAKSERMHHHYFAFSKGVARNIEVVSLHFRLLGDDQATKNLQHDEKNNFTIEWLTREEILRKMEDENHLLGFRRLVLGEVYIGQGILTNSGVFTGVDSEKAKWEITEKVGGKRKTQYRLRDWLVSRQRYWGPPIPMIWCDHCNKWIPEREDRLPVLLPDVKDFRPTGTDKSPLANFPEFYKTKCPECGHDARRETDVSDTFLDSAWYYLRYLDPHNNEKLGVQNRIDTWLPVHMYIGGAEHAVLHLLYVRFLSMALHDLTIIDFAKNIGGEPITRFRAHGLLIKDGAKISKSRGNVINPDEYIRVYGADAVRMYLMFLGPYEQGGDFRDTGIKGITRFLSRVWEMGHGIQNRSLPSDAVSRLLHKTIKKVTEDIEALQYNTAISALMVMMTEFEKNEEAYDRKSYIVFLKLLAPFAPHMTEELYEFLGGNGSIHVSDWPVYSPEYVHDKTIELVIQINGKVRDTVTVPVEISEADARALALSSEKVKTYLGARKPQKVIFVPGRLVNIVLTE